MTTDDVAIDAAALDKIFEPYNRSDAPGVAVGVALRGEPLYRRGFGLASIELPVALSPTIRMRIGSTSKHFCSLIIMLLVEDGKLSLEDSPRKHIPELPGWADAMTLRQLMSHTSGMRCSLELIFQFNGAGIAALPGAQLELLTKQDSVNFAPGTSWSYCNGGYVLLGEIIERVTGNALGGVLRDRIFEPAGMHDTLLRLYDTDLVPNSASLHVPRLDGGFNRGIFGPPLKGEGGIVSTVDDMLRWLAHMSNPVVGSPASWRVMRTPVATHGYGLGLVTGEYRGVRVVHHSGGVVGGACQMLKVVDHELDIIVMTNRWTPVSPRDLAAQIIDACIPTLSPKPEDVPATKPIAANFYSLETGAVVRLVVDDDKQAINFYGVKMALLRDPNGVLSFQSPTSDARIVPILEAGEPVAVDYSEFGTSERLRRIGSSNHDDPAGMVGRYACASAGAAGEIMIGEDDTLHFKVHGPWGEVDYVLEGVGRGLWALAGGYLETDDLGFRYSNGRIKRLQFRREPALQAG